MPTKKPAAKSTAAKKPAAKAVVSVLALERGIVILCRRCRLMMTQRRRLGLVEQHHEVVVEHAEPRRESSMHSVNQRRMMILDMSQPTAVGMKWTRLHHNYCILSHHYFSV